MVWSLLLWSVKIKLALKKIKRVGDQKMKLAAIGIDTSKNVFQIHGETIQNLGVYREIKEDRRI